MDPVATITWIVLFVIATVAVTGVVGRLGWSAPVALVIVGGAVSFIPGVPQVEVEPELILYGILPPLLFAAAIRTSVIDVRARRDSILLLSVGLVAFTVVTVNGPRTFHIGLNVYLFTALMFAMGIAWAFGKASVFKYISNDYPDNMGAISGIVGLAGGLGGFMLPILFGILVDLTGVRSSCFMLMYGVVWVSLIWMYISEVRKTPVMGQGSIGPINPASNA